MYGAASASKRRRPQRSKSRQEGHEPLLRTRTRPRVQRNATFDEKFDDNSRVDATSRRLDGTSRIADDSYSGSREYVRAKDDSERDNGDNRRRIRLGGPTTGTHSTEFRIEREEKLKSLVRLSQLVLPPGAVLDRSGTDQVTPAITNSESKEFRIEQEEELPPPLRISPARLSQLVLPPGAVLDSGGTNTGIPATSDSSVSVPTNAAPESESLSASPGEVPESTAVGSSETTSTSRCSSDHENQTAATATTDNDPKESGPHTVTTSRLRGVLRLDDDKEEAVDLSYRDLLHHNDDNDIENGKNNHINVNINDNDDDIENGGNRSDDKPRVDFDFKRRGDSCRTVLTASTSNGNSNRQIGRSALETLPRHSADGIRMEHASDCTCPECQKDKLQNHSTAFNIDSGNVDSSSHIGNNGTDANTEKIDESCLNEIWRHINICRQFVGKVVNHGWVQGFVVVMIILNAIMMGLATFDFVYNSVDASAACNTADDVFLVIFTIESACQLFYHGFQLFFNGWLTFDLLIVVLSWSLDSVQVFRAFRTLRLIARVRILRNLMKALADCIPRLGAILSLFLLVMYIYSVMFTILFSDLWERGITDADYFSGLPVTAFTLFQMNTLDWGNISRQVIAVYPWTGVLFCSYIAITSFILFSLIVAVVCDAVAVIENDSHREEAAEPSDTEPKEDYEVMRTIGAQERINNLQQKINHLKNEQLLALESIQDVIKELHLSREPGMLSNETSTSCQSPLR